MAEFSLNDITYDSNSFSTVPGGLPMDDLRAHYLNNIKLCLTDLMHPEHYKEQKISASIDFDKVGPVLKELVDSLAKQNILLFNVKNTEQDMLDLVLGRIEGRDWPEHADTMVGLRRLNDLQSCMEDVIENSIEGDFIETGVWRGGVTIFMRAFLLAHNIKDRNVWVADSFEGLPPPDEDKYPVDKGDQHHKTEYLKVTLDNVKRNFRRYSLLDDQVKFLKGWFEDTLPTAPIEKLAILRLDGDMYSSTIQTLDALYNKLSFGGYVVVDDYEAYPASAVAINDFRKDHNITDEIQPSSNGSVFWKKTK